MIYSTHHRYPLDSPPRRYHSCCHCQYYWRSCCQGFWRLSRHQPLGSYYTGVPYSRIRGCRAESSAYPHDTCTYSCRICGSRPAERGSSTLQCSKTEQKRQSKCSINSYKPEMFCINHGIRRVFYNLKSS